MKDILGYQGRRCVVVGAATGMGHACAQTLVEMGADVTALDIAPITAPVAHSLRVDLAELRRSIDAAAKQIEGEIPALFVCAGVPGPPRFDALTTMLVNFVGVRHIIEALLPQVPRGGAVALISSVAGMGYRKHLAKWKQLMAIPGFDEAPRLVRGEPGRRERLSRLEAGAERLYEAARLRAGRARRAAQLPAAGSDRHADAADLPHTGRRQGEPREALPRPDRPQCHARGDGRSVDPPEQRCGALHQRPCAESWTTATAARWTSSCDPHCSREATAARAVLGGARIVDRCS